MVTNYDGKIIDLTDERVSYLQMIQSAIDRMSTSSALFKGFAAAIIAGIIVVSLSELSATLVVCSLIPLILFAVMDTYYLQLEKRYRYVFSQVRSGKKDCDFDMSPPTVKEILKNDKGAKVRWYHCICSPSIWMFYGPMVIACLTLLCFVLFNRMTPNT